MTGSETFTVRTWSRSSCRQMVTGRSVTPMFAATVATRKSQWELSLAISGWNPASRHASRMWPRRANSGR
jgi:hypothetical protein